MADTQKKKPMEITVAMEGMADLANAIAKHASDIAHARRVLFQAYLSEGFTEPQSLELCKTLLFN